MAYVRLRSQRYYGENANVSDLRHIGNEKKAGSAFSQQGAVWTVLTKAPSRVGQYVRTNSRRGGRHFSRDEVEADLACFDV